jgi:uncharacterized membrane protein
MKKLTIIIGILIILGSFFIFSDKLNITGNVIGNSNKVITIPLSDISENAKWYEYEGIKYFIVKTNEGDIKTAFDACDICYGSKKGYSQQGDFMICNNCGNKYPISGLGTENLRGGGCWPGYLPIEIEDGNVIIKISDLEKGRYRFE